jgi:hypothetical protein
LLKKIFITTNLRVKPQIFIEILDFGNKTPIFPFSNLQVDFGEVFIPVGLEVPKPRVLPEFKRLAHGLRSSNISILDAKTFYIPNLHYDGAGPDAYFWVGNGTQPDMMGIKVNFDFLNIETMNRLLISLLRFQMKWDRWIHCGVIRAKT